MTSIRVDWEPFVESPHGAARLWDRGPTCPPSLREVRGEVAGPHAPSTRPVAA